VARDVAKLAADLREARELAQARGMRRDVDEETIEILEKQFGWDLSGEATGCHCDW
jgi:hypothetical protein